MISAREMLVLSRAALTILTVKIQTCSHRRRRIPLLHRVRMETKRAPIRMARGRLEEGDKGGESGETAVDRADGPPTRLLQHRRLRTL